MNFNPDSIKIEKPKTFSRDIERQERYLSLLKRKSESYTPKEIDFNDLYSEKEIKLDLALVDSIKEKFKKSETEKGILFKRISDIYEGVIVEQAEQNAWFGENVTFYPTSQYDDLVNGVDGVAEFSNEEDEVNYTALSFDVVFSSDAERIKNKLKRTKEAIDNGELTVVKYFENDAGEKKSIKAPRIILGSRLSSAENLIDLWGKKSSERNKKLAEHPVQVKLLLESYLQLNHFAFYANEVNQPEIGKEYAIICNKIVEILQNEKSELIEKYYNEISDDIVFETIKEFCYLTEI